MALYHLPFKKIRRPNKPSILSICLSVMIADRGPIMVIVGVMLGYSFMQPSSWDHARETRNLDKTKATVPISAKNAREVTCGRGQQIRPGTYELLVMLEMLEMISIKYLLK